MEMLFLIQEQLSVIPNGMHGIRRLFRALRDLRVGAFYLLGFGKGATVVIYPWKSLDLQAVRGRRSLEFNNSLRVRGSSLGMTN